MRSLALAAVAALGFSLGAFAADEAPRADAALEINGKTIRLTNALVVQSGNEEGLDDAAHLLVFLSDKPMPLQVAVGATTLRAQAWARANNVSAVVLRGDPAGKSAAGTASVLAAPGLEPGGFASLANTQGFSALRVAAGRASGTVSFGASSTLVKGSFDAPISAVPITQDLKDREAADSAPAKAYVAYMAALRKGDLKEAGRHATAARIKQVEDFRAQAGEMFKNMSKEIPDSASLAKSVRRVVVRGNLASVVLASKEVNELVREGDDWKID